jgi:hypothetical protein
VNDVTERALAGNLTDEDCRRIADSLFERLEERGAVSVPNPDPQSRLVDAATLARELNVSRAYVYEHANELGMVRLGGGPKPRLRFDVEKARGLLPETESALSTDNKPKPRPQRRSSTSPVPLLPVAGNADTLP